MWYFSPIIYSWHVSPVPWTSHNTSGILVCNSHALLVYHSLLLFPIVLNILEIRLFGHEYLACFLFF